MNNVVCFFGHKHRYMYVGDRTDMGLVRNGVWLSDSATEAERLFSYI